MRISRVLAFTGPSIWSRNSVLEVSLAEEPGHSRSDGAWRERCHRLCEVWRDASIELTATADRTAFLERLRCARDPLVTFLELVQELQTLAGTAVDRGWVEVEGREGPAVVVVAFVEEALARMAVDAAHRLLWGMPDVPLDLAGVVQRLRDCAAQTCFGATTRAIVTAARERGIPVSRVDGDCLVQLGHGARQRRAQGAITSRAGFLAEAVSRDKLLTKQILRQLRLPIAEGRLAGDVAEAWSAACDIGLPVVVKPRDADYGNGVSINLSTREQVAVAWERARQCRAEVLVEGHLPGFSHRLFVAGGKVVAAVRREPARVVGDGRRPVSQLIDEANRDPRRGDGPDCPFYPIEVDDKLIDVLAQQELTLASIAAPDRVVSLQRDPSSCRAEEIIDVTDRVHPSVAVAAIDAVSAVGLDVAGVDVMAVDIGRPLEEQGGGILEVNAGPAIYLHRSPQCRPQRPVAEAIVGSLFANGEAGRIPLVAVTGDALAGSVARAIAGLVDNGSQVIGLAERTGITIGTRRLTSAPGANLAGCRTLLAHPRVELAICEISPASLRREGLAFDECLVAVLTGIGGNDMNGGSQPDQPKCLRLLAACVAPGGALLANVDDSGVAAVIAPGDAHLVAVSVDPYHPFLAEHRIAGGWSISMAGSDIVLCRGHQETERLPFTAEGAARFLSSSSRVEALLAWGAAWVIDRHTPGRLWNPLRPVRIDFEANEKRLAPVERQKSVAAGRNGCAKMA
jgi:cyanophycin synthetase